MKIPMTQSQVRTLFELTKQYNMQDDVTWISFYVNDLLHLRDYDDSAPLCLLANKVDSNAVKNAQLLKNGKNSITLGANSRYLTVAQRATLLRGNIPWCVWTIDSLSPVMEYANSSAEAVTTDNITPSDVYPDD